MSIFKTYGTFDEIKHNFLTLRKVELEEKSYNGDESKLNVFSDWLTLQNLNNAPLKKITNQQLAGFFVFLDNLGLECSTIKRYYIPVKMVWKYAHEIGQYESNDLPFNLVRFPKQKKDHSPELIPKEKFADLMQDMKEHDPVIYFGANCIYYAFTRPRCELRKLKPEDFFLDKGYIKVDASIAKTDITRYPTITADLMEVIKWFGIEDAPKGKYIFGTKGYADDYTSENQLSFHFNKFRVRHGLSDGVKYYSFKYSGLTDMLNAGVPLIYVMGQAGHKRLSSTQHYAKKYGDIANNTLLNYRRVA